MVKQKKNRRIRHSESQVNYQEIETKHTRIQTWFSAISLIVAIAAIVISIITSNSQIDLEYIQSLPNLSVDAKMSTDSDTGEEWLICQIINDGGNIREAELTPHLYLQYMRMPQLVETTKKRIVLEITDVFSGGHYLDSKGKRYLPDAITYNAQEHSWFLEVKKDRLNEALDLLFLIGDPLREYPLEEDYLWADVTICFEVSYIDIRGEKQEEWYYASEVLDLIQKESESSVSFQMRRVDKNSIVPLHVYHSASQRDKWLEMGEDLALERNEESIAIAVQWCYDALFCE